MFKTLILNYHTSLKNSFKSSRVTFSIASAIIAPVVLYILLLVFEDETAAFIMELVPPSIRQGFVFFTDLVSLVRIEILWIGFFMLLALVCFFYPTRDALLSFMEVRSRIKAVYLMMLIASAFFLTTVWIADVALEGFPNSSDEYAYLFQAEMFSRGKWWERAHDLPGFFYLNNIPQHDGILVSRFPPGWPLVLSTAFEIGMSPTLINPLLGLITLIVLYSFANRYYGRNVAVWTILLVALSGFYLFNAASFFSHVSCALFVLLFVYSIHLYRDKQLFAFGVLAGFFLGFVILIRYYTAVLIFVPFFIYLLFEYRWRVIPLFFWMGIGSFPCLAYLLWYNYSITGNALLPVTVWAYPDEQLGFVRGHTIWKGLEHFARRTAMLVYWSSPGLLLLYAVYLYRKIKDPVDRAVHPEDYAFLALTVGYFFYYQIGGNQYGPRFMFEALPFMVLFVVRQVFVTRAKWAVAVLLACAIYPVVKLPFITYREERIVDQRQDVYDLVREQKIENAVVIVTSPTSPIRPMPAEDLTRNDPMFMNDVIYVVNIPTINQTIMDYYNDRSVYRYVRDVNKAHGELIRIR